jgi:hypothetical protein
VTFAQIRPGAKGALSRPANDQGKDVIVLPQLVTGCLELANQPGIERVQRLRPIQRKRRDVTLSV